MTPRSPSLFRLCVDDGGEWIVAVGERLVLGHARDEGCDLPFLADLPPACAILSRERSLREGPGWRLAPLEGGSARIGGASVAGEGRRLADGDHLELGVNLALRFGLPDLASDSAVLALGEGAECLGARRVVLLAPGAGGRVRIGAVGRLHVPTGRAGCEVTLVLEGGQLVVASPAGVHGAGADGSSARLDCPPQARVDLRVGAISDAAPPFGLAFEPVESPANGGARA